METYELTCTCGHVMTVEANSEKEAVMKMKEEMDEMAIMDHWQEMHKGEPMPSVKDVHKMIETELVPATAVA